MRHGLARDHSAFFGRALKSQHDDAFDVLYGEWFFKHVRGAEIEELRPKRRVGMPGRDHQREARTGVPLPEQVTPGALTLNPGVTHNQSRVQLVNRRPGADQVGNIHYQPTVAIDEFPKCVRIPGGCRDEDDGSALGP